MLVPQEGLPEEDTFWETLAYLKQDYPHLHLEDKVVFPGAGNVVIDNRMEGVAEEVGSGEDYKETSGEKKGNILKTYPRNHRSVKNQFVNQLSFSLTCSIIGKENDV